MDRASQVLAQGVPPGVPRSYPQSTDGNINFSPEGSLCNACAAVPLKSLLANSQERFLLDLTGKGKPYHHFNPPLLVSSNSTCPLCRLLAASFHSHSITVKSMEREELGDTLTLGGQDTRSFCVRVSASTEQRSSRIALLGVDAFRLSSRRFSYARRLVPQQADRNLMASWLKSCLRHGGCNTISGIRDPVSKFLINVNSMCVVDVGSAPKQYFALSYVWGNSSSLWMVQDNKLSLMTPGYFNDNIEKLSPVVQDAITITKELGERYLWVDSLCICQDDAQTKYTQISNMNHIYKQAKATLVAATETSSSSGLPGVRPFKSPRDQCIEFAQGIHLSVLLSPISETRSTYFQRAWTYQEERLSRRIFYFTEHQAYFHCLQSMSCEDRWEDSSPYPRGGEILNNIYPYTRFEWWKKAVCEFSARQHSIPEDRYNAFQGIAAELRERWTYPCIRSLPEQDLVAALCWKPLVQESQRIPSLPSWTWCGWTGRVGFPYSSMLSLVWSMEAFEDTENSLGGRYLALESTSPLTLGFLALSALLDLKFHNGFWGVQPDGLEEPNGSISIVKDEQLRDQPQKFECIRLGATRSWISGDAHTHFPTDLQERNESAKHIWRMPSVLQSTRKAGDTTQPSSPPVDPSIANRDLVMLVVESNDGHSHQRIGIGFIKECCFMANHPIERNVRLR